MRVAIVTGGFFTLFSSKNGAVETLSEEIVCQNEVVGDLDLVVYGIADDEAKSNTKGFKNCSFEYIGVPLPVLAGDRIIYFIAKDILRKTKHLSYRYILQRLWFIRSVGKGLAKEPVDRIVFENSPTLLMALRVKDNRDRYANKWMYHMHNILPSFFGCEEDMLACRKVLGVSEYVLRELREFSGNRFDERKLVVLRNRVDERAFTGEISPERAQGLREKHCIPEGAKVVLFGGRLTSEKGALELIEAFGKLGDMNVVLLVLGSYYYGSKMCSEYEIRLQEAAKSLGERIIFTGFVAHDEMPDYYALADVVCAPSVWSDPAPLAVIEPLTAGRPLITTEMGGIPEYATDGVDSVVLPLGEAFEDRLAAAIRGVLDGQIQLSANKAESWDVASYYRDFVRFVSE